YREWDVRSYRLAQPWAGRPDLEVGQPFAPGRAFVPRIRRAEQLVDVGPGTVPAAGGAVAVGAGRRGVAGGLPLRTGSEERALLDFPVESLDVVLTSSALVDGTLEAVAQQHGRGIALIRLVRGGEEIPFAASTTLNRGDLLRITGPSQDVERAGKALGYIERPSATTDVVFVGLGIVLGGLVGLLSLNIGGLPISLTSSGGALIMGLVFGWLRSVYPTFGRIPEPALWVFDTIGLAVFIGIVGINAAPGFVDGLRRTGVSLVIVGFMAAVLPHLTAL